MSRILVRRACNQIHSHYLRHSATTAATAPLQKITLPINRSTISYISEGDPSANLVFVALHGGPGSHKDFKYISQNFVDEKTIETKHSIIRLDLPGYGESTEFPSNPTSHNYASAVIEALEIVIPRDKKIVLIGIYEY
jgi:pimeloyl-ACP methyl ester carboxylesterase